MLRRVSEPVAGVPSTEAKSAKRRKWPWIVASVVALFAIFAMLGNDAERKQAAQKPATTPMSAATVTSSMLTSTVPPVTTATQPPTETLTPSAAAEPDGLSDSQKLGDAIKDNYGNTTWGQTITDVELRSGMLRVRAQISGADKDTAAKIQRGVFNLVTTASSLPKVDWVIVEDGTGTVITQKKTP